MARNVLGDDYAAEDCVHDSLLRVWQTPGAYRPERGDLRPFLVACVRNEAMTMMRSSQRRSAREQRSSSLEPRSDAPFEVPDYVELQRLRDALAVLPKEQRIPLDLAYFGNRTHVQIASDLSVPLGTVKSRLASALRRLAAELGVRPEARA